MGDAVRAVRRDKVGFFLPARARHRCVGRVRGRDPSYPIRSGFFWSDDQLPDDATAATSKVLRTQKASLVLNDDTPEIHLVVDECRRGDHRRRRRRGARPGEGDGGHGRVHIRTRSGKVAVEQSGVSINSGALEVK